MHMNKKPTTDQLIHGIYETALDDTPWTDLFPHLVESFSSYAGQLFTPFLRDSTQGGFGLSHGFPDDAVQRYLSEVADVDVWYHTLLRRYGVNGRVPTGLVYNTNDLLPTSQLQRTRFFADYVRTLDIGESLGSIVGDGSSEQRPVPGLVVYRNPSAKPYEASDRARLVRLQQHFTRAVEIRMRIRRAATEAVAQTLDTLTNAVVVLAGDGTVLLANAAADRLLTQRQHPQIRFGRLRAEAAIHTTHLECALKDCARCQMGAPESFVVRLAGEAGSGVIAHLLPPPARWPVGPRAVAIAFLLVEGRGAPAAGELLKALYGLSPSEVALVMALSEGHTPESHSETRGVSMNTVRTQLKSVFHKTQVRRQADLMRLVHSIAR